MIPKKILIVDDHQVVVMGVLQMFHNQGIQVNLTHASDLEDASKILYDGIFDMVILDINVPGGNKPSMIEAIRKVKPKINILIYSGCDESLYAYPFFKAGANGFLSKNSTEKEFILAVEKVMNGEKYLSPFVFQQIIGKVGDGPETGLHSLTPREIQIMQYLMKGTSLSTIGDELFLHVSTVSTHKIKIFKKLGVSNLPEMIDYVKLNIGASGILAG